MFYVEGLKNECEQILEQVNKLINSVELLELTNEQWFINFENDLNLLSVKDHNADQNS